MCKISTTFDAYNLVVNHYLSSSLILFNISIACRGVMFSMSNHLIILLIFSNRGSTLVLNAHNGNDGLRNHDHDFLSSFFFSSSHKFSLALSIIVLGIPAIVATSKP